jgi:hypothetical protein
MKPVLKREKQMDDTPRVGDMVHYFMPNNSVVPHLAFVTEIHHRDLVGLAVWNGQSLIPKQAMHRKDCQALLDSPMIARRNGYWDFRDTAEARKTMSALLELASSTKQKPATTDQTKTKV